MRFLRAKILHDFSSIQSAQIDYLYPFVNIKKGGRLIVFGAGAYGRAYIDYLEKCSDFTVVAWADNHLAGERIGKWTIISKKDIIKQTFDYVIIASNKSRFIYEIRRELTELDIKEDQIGDLLKIQTI